MNEVKKFSESVKDNIKEIGKNEELRELSGKWLASSLKHKYSYNFNWLGRPIIQYPQDIVAVQELIWDVKPDLIIETGIAHGGSLIMSASFLALLDLFDAERNGNLDAHNLQRRKVLGIDIDIRQHNKTEIRNHPLSSRIDMIQGSSTDPGIIATVTEYAANFKRVLLLLDSNHTHDHVLSELIAYTPLVTPGSYCIVFDTVIEDMPENSFPDRDWDIGNNPKTAVRDFLKTNPQFVVDEAIEKKLLITVAPSGFLRRL